MTALALLTLLLTAPPEPAPLWERPTQGYPSLVGASVVLLTPDGHVERVDARTGKLLWRRPPPKGVRWTGVEAQGAVVALEGQAKGKPARAVASLSDGKVRFRVDGAPRLRLGGGGALAAYDRQGFCRTRVLDVAKGLPISPWIRGLRYERRPLRGGRRISSCRPGVELLLQLGRDTVLSGRDHGFWLAAYSPTSRPWKAQLIDRGVGLAGASQPHHAAWGSTWSGTTVYGFEARSARRRWHYDLPRPAGCKRPADTPRPLADGGLVLQVCDRVVLLDLATGKPRWEVKTDDLAVVIGEDGRQGLGPRGRGFPWHVRWVTPDGRLAERQQVSKGTHALLPAPGGLLALLNGSSELWARDGTTRWRRPQRFTNWHRAGRWLILQDAAEPRGQEVIDWSTGKVTTRVRGGVFVTGVTGDVLVLHRYGDKRAVLAVPLR